MSTLELIVKHKISIDYCGKAIWACQKNTSGVIINQVMVRFKETFGDEAKAVELAVNKLVA
jgi:hypothetical protein